MGLRISIESDKMRPEDASCNGKNYAFVFDGLGGTGGTVRQNMEQERRTEAWIASDVSAKAVKKYLDNKFRTSLRAPNYKNKEAVDDYIHEYADKIHEVVDNALSDACKTWNIPSESGKLPSTIAGWISFPLSDDRMTLAAAFWAGDSRCYAIDKNSMKLYSRDDAEESIRRDAMEDCISKDSLPMNNRIGMDKKWTLHCRFQVFEQPVLLMSCTDGFYNSFPSPMNLEHDFRYVGEKNTFESMAEDWKSFVLEHGLFQDDSATAETIFLASDSSDPNALAAMLFDADRIRELSEKYLPIPRETDDADKVPAYVDIDRRILGLVRILCLPGASNTFKNEKQRETGEKARQLFIDGLRENVRRFVVDADDSEEYPVSCANVIKEIRLDYADQMKKYNQLESECKNTHDKFWNRIAEVKICSINTEQEAVQPAGEIRNFIESSPANTEIIEQIKGRLYRIYAFIRAMSDHQLAKSWAELFEITQRKEVIQFYYYPSRDQYGYEHYYPFSVGRNNTFVRIDDDNLKYLHALTIPFPGDSSEAYRQAWQMVADVSFLINKLAEINVGEGLDYRSIADKAKSSIKWEKIDEDEQYRLGNYILRLAGAEYKEQYVTDSDIKRVTFMPVTPYDVLDLFEFAKKCAMAETAKRGGVVPEPHMDEFENYLKANLKREADTLIRRWLEIGSIPPGYRFLEEFHDGELYNLLYRQIKELIKNKADNEELLRLQKEEEQELIELWNHYRIIFETYDEPYNVSAEVVWLNEDRTELDRKTYKGKEPSTDKCPTKIGDTVYTYTFIGWKLDKDEDGVKTYIPNFSKTERPVYTVIWKNNDGSILDRKSYREGQKEPSTDKIPCATPNHMFLGWGEPEIDSYVKIYYPRFEDDLKSEENQEAKPEQDKGAETSRTPDDITAQKISASNDTEKNDVVSPETANGESEHNTTEKVEDMSDQEDESNSLENNNNGGSMNWQGDIPAVIPKCSDEKFTHELMKKHASERTLYDVKKKLDDSQ